MDSAIIITDNMLEAKPFFPDRFFINPDKQIIKYELPFKKAFKGNLALFNPFKADGNFGRKIDKKV